MLTTDPFVGHLHISSRRTPPTMTFNISLMCLIQNHHFLAFRRFVRTSHASLDINRSFMIVAQIHVAVILGHMLSFQHAPFAKKVVISPMAKNLASALLIFLLFPALLHLHATRSTLHKCSTVTNIARQRRATTFRWIFSTELNTRRYARHTSQSTPRPYPTNTSQILVILPLDFQLMDLLHSTSGKRRHGHYWFLTTISPLTFVFMLKTSFHLVLFQGPRSRRTPTPSFGHFFKNFSGWRTV